MKSEAAPRRHRRPRQYVWAAATVLAICLAVVLQPSFNIWLTADYTTSTAQIRNIRLEDGSIVHLGADSAIEIAFEPEMRRIQLLSGEAYFEVEPNPMRPFKVEARNVETTVLGTAFDVRLMSDGVTVAVNRGRVGVVGSRAARSRCPSRSRGLGACRSEWASRARKRRARVGRKLAHWHAGCEEPADIGSCG